MSEKSDDQKVSTAKINIQLGVHYLQENNVFRAKQKLILALNQAPNIPETWYTMAYYFEITGNNEEAQRYYLKSIAIAPERGDVQNNYGTYLCRMGRYKESIKYFLLAAENPQYLDTASAYENAGFCALKIPDRNLAIKYFNKAVIEDPKRLVSQQELKKLMKNKG
jgi:type IV pilus assembly protein PilF